MTEDNKERIQEDYHLNVGGILYKLAIVKDFTCNSFAIRPHLLRTANNSCLLIDFVKYFKFLPLTPPPPPEAAAAPRFHHKILALPAVT